MLKGDYDWIEEKQVTEEIENIFSSESFLNNDLRENLKLILNCIDLTTLEGNDTKQRVTSLCRKAYSFSEKNDSIPNVAAVCVYPVFAKLVRENLKEKNIKTACVAGSFPSGQSIISIKLQEIQYAIDEGAEEIDMVVSRGALLEENYNQFFDEISMIREQCHNNNARVKAILETGELQSLQNIAIASDLAIEAGVDFIKTSTGKIAVSATEPAAFVMLNAIKNQYRKTGRMVGFKAAGGISTPEQAIRYLLLAKSVLGTDWMNSQYFRIGASRLADAVFEKIEQGCS